MASHVRRARVRVRARGIGIHPSARRKLHERFQRETVSGILDNCERELQQALGTTELRLYVRRLALRWTLDERQLEHADWIASAGNELATAILGMTRRTRQESAKARAAHSQRSAKSDDSAVLFRSVAEERASVMLAGTSSTRPWWLSRSGVADPVHEASREGSQAIHALMQLLAQLDGVAQRETLRRVPVASLKLATRALPLERWPLPGEVLLELAERCRRSPTTPTSTKHPRPPQPDGVAPPNPTTGQPDDSGPAEPARHAHSEKRPPESPRATERELRSDAGAQQSAPQAPAGTDVDRTAPAATSAASPTLDGAPPPDMPVQQLGVSTAFAGLFYLVATVLELDLGQHLWCAGVREGRVLRGAAQLLVGASAATDPAPALFAGEAPKSVLELEPVERWALDEVREHTWHCLRRALQRRRIEIAESALGDALGGLETELARAAHAQRIEPARTQLPILSAAMLTTLFQLRLGEPTTLNALRPHLEVRGRVRVTDDQLLVVMSMDDIDLQLRKATLDRNPGLAPWLGKRVQLEFEPRS